MKYLGVKVVEATPMTSGEAIKLNYKTNCLSLSEPGYEVTYEGGYKSWSPADVFEKSHRSFGEMTFGMAIEALKQGRKVSRSGWNGKGMWVCLAGGEVINPQRPIGEKLPVDGFLPWIGMKTVDNTFVPWLASQTDVLAEDWCIIE